ncbi:MAG: DUF4339 domain-containing protein [Planctomycetota bacterium]|nr:DUF4339 domain-containing protein [Planctomycetota bacterium]
MPSEKEPKERTRRSRTRRPTRRQKQTATRHPKTPTRSTDKMSDHESRSIEIDSTGVIVAQPLLASDSSVEAIVVQPISTKSQKKSQSQLLLKAESKEILFGKIAVDCGYATQKEIDNCVLEQKDEQPNRSLGQILFDSGILERAEIEEIISIQNQNLQKRYDYTGKPLEVSLFGALVVAQNLATREQVNECLRWQAEIERFGERLSLGELLVARDYMEESKIEVILEQQKKREFRCQTCREIFTTSLFEQGRSIHCPHCDEIVGVPESSKRPAPSVQKVESNQKPDLSPPAAPQPQSLRTQNNRNERRKARRSQKLKSQTTADSTHDEKIDPIELDKAKGWYIGLGETAYGPLKLRRIRKLIGYRALGTHDLIWHESFDDWTLPGEIPELRSLLKSTGSVAKEGSSEEVPCTPPLRTTRKIQRVLARIEKLNQKGKLKNREYADFKRVFETGASS